MKRWMNIGIALAVTAFICTNAILLFSEKSVILKQLYASDYLIAKPDAYEKQLPKEAFVSPLERTVVQLASEQAVDGWLVKEGDAVTAGSELARLNTAALDEQKAVWSAEQSALQSSFSELNSTISQLESEQNNANSNTSTNDNLPVNEKQDVQVNVDVQVEEAGSYAAAIAEATADLAEAEARLAVVEAQLQQTGTPSLLSPIDGIVKNINQDGTPSVEIYSSSKTIVTYAVNNEWQSIEANDRVRIQSDGLEKAIEGTVLSVSQVPAEKTDWRGAFTDVSNEKAAHRLAYYEVVIQPNEMIDQLPYGYNVNTQIVTDEATDAVLVGGDWPQNRHGQEAELFVLDEHGDAKTVPVQIGFDKHAWTVVTQGVNEGDVVVNKEEIGDYVSAPRMFMPFPMELPSWKHFKKAFKEGQF